ncbi:unnamed protein product, partial [Polarella glacialis]
MSFPTLRKVLSKEREVSMDEAHLRCLKLNPGADDPVPPRERCLVIAKQVQSMFRMDFGLAVSDEDMSFLAVAFCFHRDPKKRTFHGPWREWLLDADLLVDALRGEPSPGRRQTLDRLYTLLQEEAGIPRENSLNIGWVEKHMSDVERAAELESASANPILRSFTPEDLLDAFPLLWPHD